MHGSVMFVASVCKHIYGFHMPYMRMLRDKGYDVLVSARADETRATMQDEGFRCIDVPFSRNPLSPENIGAFRLLCTVFKAERSLRLVHVHTPVAAFLTRVAAVRSGYRGKIMYTAHGFHFYSGAGLLNWLLFYPLEVLAARFTDCLITINKEDYARALRFRLRCDDGVCYVPGVGVNLSYYSSC